MKRSIFLMAVFFVGLVLLFTAGCKDEFLELTMEDIRAPRPTELTSLGPEAPSLKDELAGEWVITSYSINGIEYLGTIVKNAEWRFSEIAMPDAHYEQDVYFMEGGYDKFFGTYRVNEDLGTLTFICGPQVMEGKLHMQQGIKMSWKGMHGTDQAVILARRKINAR